MDIIKYEDPLGELDRVYYVEPFEKELSSLFGKSKQEFVAYEKYLVGCLNLLDKSSEHLSSKPFEHLKVDGFDLYRIESKSNKKNVRVIYFYTDDDDDIVLLCAFEEKNKSDYHLNINKAKLRIKYITEE